MMKVTEQAIEALQGMPQQRQEMLARAILNYATQAEDEVYHLSEEERRLVDEGVASPFVAEQEMEAFWRQHAR